MGVEVGAEICPRIHVSRNSRTITLAARPPGRQVAVAWSGATADVPPGQPGGDDFRPEGKS
jgi:hypothetical protein